MSRWNQPLGAQLMISTATSTPDPIAEFLHNNHSRKTKSPVPSSTLPSSENITVDRSKLDEIGTPTVEDQKPYCGGPPLMYILAFGIDNSIADYRYGLADVIRIARIDFLTPKVTVLTLPRDLWIELPGIKEQYENLTHAKINSAYFYGSPAMNRYEGDGGGPGLLAHTIAHNYGLVVDHYFLVNMEVFEDIVDALGGITIYLDRTWDGRADRNNPEHMAWVFEEGLHHMSGAEALRFARIRLNQTEIMRTDNQTQVLCAMRDKALSPAVFSALPDLVRAFFGRVQTDLTPAQLSQLICLSQKIESENLQFVRFPDEYFVQGRVFDPVLNNTTFVWDIEPENIRQFLNDFENDAIPIKAGDGESRLCP